jgi:hypothetical protein
MKTINQKKYKDLIEYTIRNNSVLYVEGKPGIGKSQIVAQVAKEMDRKVIDIRAALIGEGDLLTKIVNVDRNRLLEVVSEIMPREENTVILLDEFRHAHRDIRRMFYQIILDRRLGSSYKLPDNTAIIILSNKSEDVDTEELENALYDRMVMRVEVEGNFDIWKEYAYKNNIREEIVAYLEVMKDHFIYYGAEDTLEMSPRRWEEVSKHWEMRQYVMSDIISGAFEEFIQSVLEYKDLDKFLSGKKEIPQRLDEQYKIATAILMSGDKKLYEMLLRKNPGFTAEVDIFLILGCIRKYTGDTVVREAYRKLPTDIIDDLLNRLPEYEWIFKR